MNDSTPLGWDEAPTEAAKLVILLLPEGNWQAAGSSPGSTPIVLARPLPTERRGPACSRPGVRHLLPRGDARADCLPH